MRKTYLFIKFIECAYTYRFDRTHQWWLKVFHERRPQFVLHRNQLTHVGGVVILNDIFAAVRITRRIALGETDDDLPTK